MEDWFAVLSRRRTGPWLAHRLDADTAGCLAIARRKATLVALQALFATGAVEKTYWAVVAGHPGAAHGQVENRLDKRRDHAGWRMVAADSGQAAITDWRVLGIADGLSVLELRPRTGRTHQIRVHCAGLGCPILGDRVYGAATGDGLQLLARALHLPLTPPAAAVAVPPRHMHAALVRCGWDCDHGPGWAALNACI